MFCYDLVQFDVKLTYQRASSFLKIYVQINLR